MVPSLFSLPSSSVQVLDAEEEVFTLYSSQFSTLGSAGLGSYDSMHDDIAIDIDLTPPFHEGIPSASRGLERETRSVHVNLRQNITGLRSRKGDTGSVLWRASIELARAVLGEYHYPSHAPGPFFNLSKLREAHVLELGSGVGLLSCLFAPLVKHYTVTDLPEMLPLIQRNMEGNVLKVAGPHPIPPASRGRGQKKRRPLGTEIPPNYTIAALDWTAVASSASSSTARRIIRSSVLGSPSERVDLIIAVDTLYNTSLVPPFLATLEEFAHGPGPEVDSGVRESAAVLVVCELRDEDVIRDFLEGWLSLGDWEIWRVGGRAIPGMHGSDDGAQKEGNASEPFLSGPFVVWLGWKS